MSDLDKPEGLSDKGQKAYETIVKFLQHKSMTYTGGCKAFYSPQEWAERGESYGTNSHLVVVHDGGDLARIFNIDYGSYILNEDMNNMLAKSGMFAEACTTWYTAIYGL